MEAALFIPSPNKSVYCLFRSKSFCRVNRSLLVNSTGNRFKGKTQNRHKIQKPPDFSGGF